MDFQRYVMPYMNSNMYVLIEDSKALVIDPNLSQKAIHELCKKGVQQVTILLTHEHFDHISGTTEFARQYHTMIICQQECASSIAVKKNNRPLALLKMITKKNKMEIKKFYESCSIEPICADITFDQEYQFNWQGHHIRLVSMPGHSRGSVVVEFDQSIFFTGDYMIPDVPVILRYPGGSAKDYEQYTLPYLLNIQGESIIMPGHANGCYKNQLVYQDWIFYRKGCI